MPTTDLPLGPISLPDLAELVGTLPPGDVPAAWWISTDEEVLAGWNEYRRAHRAWQAAWAKLLQVSGLPTTTRPMVINADTVLGVVPPAGASFSQRWWRWENNCWVPRKRTREEKVSVVRRLFGEVERLPRAVIYMPGMPAEMWVRSTPTAAVGNKGYQVAVRKTGQAVCAFVGVDPVAADPPFEVGPQWTPMKISTFHQLRERQAAAGLTRE